MELAFAAGNDPALELAQHSNKQADIAAPGEPDELDELTFDGPSTTQLTASGNLRRREQDWIDRIVHGTETGHYYVLLGPKVRTSRVCLSAFERCMLMYATRAQERLQ